VVESGVSLSEYIMPGLGGRALSHEHAFETAKILNQIRPDFIRVRTLAIHPMSPLQRMVDEGIFEPLSDEEVVIEIRALLEHLDEMPTHFRCGDFSLNLLMQVDGRLDTHKQAMIDEIDRYLALSKEQKQAYSLIQRTYPGMRDVSAVHDDDLMNEARVEIRRLEKQQEDGFNKYIRSLMTRQLPQLQTDCWDG
jgi:histone acetyltransferase (RNA polymerase elongator complex component)